jgi:hypothetical protein
LRGRLETQKSAIVYKIVNEKTAKIIEDRSVYRGAELNTEICLISTRWENKQNPMRQGNTSQEEFKFLLVKA